jgi:hypothetical protein
MGAALAAFTLASSCHLAISAGCSGLGELRKERVVPCAAAADAGIDTGTGDATTSATSAATSPAEATSAAAAAAVDPYLPEDSIQGMLHDLTSLVQNVNTRGLQPALSLLLTKRIFQVTPTLGLAVTASIVASDLRPQQLPSLQKGKTIRKLVFEAETKDDAALAPAITRLKVTRI